MLVAWITNHRGNGFFIFRPGEGWEYVMTLTFCGLAIAAIGGGEWSLDHALEIDDDLGSHRSAHRALAGVGGASRSSRLLATEQQEGGLTTP